MFNFIKLSFILFLLTACGHHLNKSIQDKDGYKLIWSDEFNRNGTPDSANWGYEEGFVRNEELQWYQQQNARCENGNLIIEAKREEKPNPRYQAGNND